MVIRIRIELRGIWSGSRNFTIFPELCRKLNNKADYVYLMSAWPTVKQAISSTVGV